MDLEEFFEAEKVDNVLSKNALRDTPHEDAEEERVWNQVYGSEGWDPYVNNDN
jgi:hypothetical protein